MKQSIDSFVVGGHAGSLFGLPARFVGNERREQIPVTDSATKGIASHVSAGIITTEQSAVFIGDTLLAVVISAD
jgi:hypothetical protein